MKIYLQRALLLYSRLFLGILFFFASLNKVTDIRGFAVLVSDYPLLPEFLLLPFAFALAWTEMFCGIFLLFGWRIKMFGLIAAGLFFLFLIAIGTSLVRGLEIDCGCFDIPLFGSPKIGWHTLVRNSIFLAISLLIVFMGSQHERNNRPSILPLKG